MSVSGLSGAVLSIPVESSGLGDKKLRDYGRRGALAGHERSGDRREVSKSQWSLGETEGLESATQNMCGATLPLVGQKEEEFLLPKSTYNNWRNHFKKVQLVKAPPGGEGRGFWQWLSGERDTRKRREKHASHQGFFSNS